MMNDYVMIFCEVLQRMGTLEGYLLKRCEKLLLCDKRITEEKTERFTGGIYIITALSGGLVTPLSISTSSRAVQCFLFTARPYYTRSTRWAIKEEKAVPAGAGGCPSRSLDAFHVIDSFAEFRMNYKPGGITIVVCSLEAA